MSTYPEYPIGFSDHTLGTIIPLAAVTLGACLIEKHFTLSRDSGSPDDAFSLTPDEFKEMVDAGMPALQAILSATREASILLGQNSVLGSISPGKYADLIAVSKDPLLNIKILESIDFVMKGGEIYKSP